MSKFSPIPVNSVFNINAINENNRKLAEIINNQILFRDNPVGEPNEMKNDLDMNSKRVYNLPEPVLEHEAARKKDLDETISTANSILHQTEEERRKAEIAKDQAEAAAQAAKVSELITEKNVELTTAIVQESAKGNYHYFSDKASAVAANIPEGHFAQVFRDETMANSNVIYRKIGGALVLQVDLDSLRKELASPTGGRIIGFRNKGSTFTRSQHDKNMDVVSVLDYGAKGNGVTEDAAIQQAVDSGAKTILFPWGTSGEYKFANVDFKGVNVLSHDGITLNGTPVNVGKMTGVVLVGNEVSEKTNATMPSLKFSGGFVVKYRELAQDNDDAYYVLTKNSAREEYVAIRVRASPAADTGPWELQRIQGVFSCHGAYAYQSVLPGKAVSASYSGTGWNDFTVTASVLGLETGSTGGPEGTAIIGRRTNVVNDFVEITVKPDIDGKINLTFLKSANMSRDVQITYGSVTENISLVDSTLTNPAFHTISLSTRSLAPVTVRITQLDTNRYLTFVASNMDTPDKVRKDIFYDSWSYYVMPSYKSYVVNPGAHEYAIRDSEASPPSFVGSYHGREVALEAHKWILDGAPKVFANNVPLVATKNILLKQQTRISDKLDTWSDYRFGDGSAEFICDLQGVMKSSTVYLGMELSQLYNSVADKVCFNEILYPKRIDVTEAGRYPLGNTELIVWRNPETEARVYFWVKSFTGYASMNGGASIESSYGNTTYSKARTGMQQDAENTFKGASLHYIKVYA